MARSHIRTIRITQILLRKVQSLDRVQNHRKTQLSSYHRVFRMPDPSFGGRIVLEHNHSR